MSDYMLKMTGDAAVSVIFSGEISVSTNLKVRALKYALEQTEITGILELVPAYCSLMIHYDPLRITYAQLEKAILAVLENLQEVNLPSGTVTEIPVLYGGQFGEDLDEVAAYEHITPEEVIAHHSAYDSFVYMIAFAPGLPYIGAPTDTFTIPRRTSPRTKIPCGSVTIWKNQTTVFPVDQPGGWHVIGRTPLKLFQPENREKPFLIESGHWVRFHPISEAEYLDIERQVNVGIYLPHIYEKQSEV